MSQTAAYGYANLGYDYQQILGVYYPGVAIALAVDFVTFRNKSCCERVAAIY
jgi:peptidoglycan hydrolase-like amidase